MISDGNKLVEVKVIQLYVAQNRRNHYTCTNMLIDF